MRLANLANLANLAGRAVLVPGDEVADIADASDPRFGPDPSAVYDDWDAFTTWAAGVDTSTGPLVESELRNPVPHRDRCSPSGSTTALTPTRPA